MWPFQFTAGDVELVASIDSVMADARFASGSRRIGWAPSWPPEGVARQLPVPAGSVGCVLFLYVGLICAAAPARTISLLLAERLCSIIMFLWNSSIYLYKVRPCACFLMFLRSEYWQGN